MNTDQFGRTFEDRSHTFLIRKSPVKAHIVNLNVQGQRGNIVENYPSVEYDFVPRVLYVSTSDYIHRQVGGSNTSPNGAGEGQANSDRSNFVEVTNATVNYPDYLTNVTQVDNPASDGGYATVKKMALYGQGSAVLNSAAPNQDLGLTRYNSPRTINYISTRNNNFSNRSQKGVIQVNNGSKKTIFTPLVIAGIVAGGVLVIAAVAGLVFLGVTASVLSGALQNNNF